jgi:hypothetical protein
MIILCTKGGKEIIPPLLGENIDAPNAIKICNGKTGAAEL